MKFATLADNPALVPPGGGATMPDSPEPDRDNRSLVHEPNWPLRCGVGAMVGAFAGLLAAVAFDSAPPNLENFPRHSRKPN